MPGDVCLRGAFKQSRRWRETAAWGEKENEGAVERGEILYFPVDEQQSESRKRKHTGSYTAAMKEKAREMWKHSRAVIRG